MHDLGFPPAAIEVVADLYTNAVTRIKLNFAVTDPIELGRGTIQGDIPSPILFLIFIEPLLRWLQSGGRGYKHKCLINTPEDGHTISSLAYADDLAAMTNIIADMKVQAQKVQAFVAWSGMTVDCKNCAITGILYGQADRDGSSSVLSKSMINMVKDRVRQIEFHNMEIRFYHPHTDLSKYLGVDITPTFNWAPHLDRTLTETKQKAERLTNCALSKAQKMRILPTAIDPSITYSFAIGCMTELDISKFDAIRTRTCKRINGLPVSSSSAMVHQDADQAGLGLPSLMKNICRSQLQIPGASAKRHRVPWARHPSPATVTRQGHWSGPHPAKQQTILAPNFSLPSGPPARNSAALRTSADNPTRACHPERKCTTRNTIQNTL